MAGIEGNGQTEFVYGLTGLSKLSSGKLTLDGKDITHATHPPALQGRHGPHPGGPPQARPGAGLSRWKTTWCCSATCEPEFQKGGFIRADKVREYADRLIEQYDVRSGQGTCDHRAQHVRRQPAEGHHRPRDRPRPRSCSCAVQPTRGLDVGAIEYIHRQLVAERDKGKAVLLV